MKRLFGILIFALFSTGVTHTMLQDRLNKNYNELIQDLDRLRKFTEDINQKKEYTKNNTNIIENKIDTIINITQEFKAIFLKIVDDRNSYGHTFFTTITKQLQDVLNLTMRCRKLIDSIALKLNITASLKPIEDIISELLKSAESVTEEFLALEKSLTQERISGEYITALRQANVFISSNKEKETRTKIKILREFGNSSARFEFQKLTYRKVYDINIINTSEQKESLTTPTQDLYENWQKFLAEFNNFQRLSKPNQKILFSFIEQYWIPFLEFCKALEIIEGDAPLIKQYGEKLQKDILKNITTAENMSRKQKELVMSWNQTQTRHLVGSLLFGSDPVKVQKPYRTTLEKVKTILNTAKAKQESLDKIINLFPTITFSKTQQINTAVASLQKETGYLKIAWQNYVAAAFEIIPITFGKPEHKHEKIRDAKTGYERGILPLLDEIREISQQIVELNKKIYSKIG